MMPANSDEKPRSAPVSLEAPLAATEDRRLLVQYQVVNSLEETIYLVNRIFVWTRKGLSLDPNFINTEVLGNRLRLTKAFIDVPKGVRAEEPEVPYLSEVTARSHFVERLDLPLPLEPFHPYNVISRQDEIHIFQDVELAVGWFPGSAVDTHQVQGQDGQTLLAADHQEVRREQRLLVVHLPVQVPAHFGPS